jgi:hypothetical protein
MTAFSFPLSNAMPGLKLHSGSPVRQSAMRHFSSYSNRRPSLYEKDVCQSTGESLTRTLHKAGFVQQVKFLEPEYAGFHWPYTDASLKGGGLAVIAGRDPWQFVSCLKPYTFWTEGSFHWLSGR